MKIMAIVCVAVAALSGTCFSAAEENNINKTLEVKNSYDTIQQNRSLSGADNARITDELAQLKKDYQKLSEDHKMVVADRDNLLVQTKKLIAAKNRSEEMLSMLEQIQGGVAKSEKEKNALAMKNRALQESFDKLQEAQKQCAAAQKQALTEKEQLSTSVASMKQQLESGTLQKEVARLKKANATLASELKQSAEENQKLKEIRDISDREFSAYREKAEALQQQHKEAVRRVRAYEEKLSESPAKLAELASQNKALTEQTATMHYNLGVFYTRQKEYSRAAVEFQKTIDLKPDDPQAHFNLGYIYAEHIVDRPKAVKHFQEYLQYVKKDDEDVDWVKRYILTWQAWEGKEPIK